MKFYLLSAFICISPLLFATNYVFTGNGDFSASSNWANGAVPPSTLGSSDTVTINGIATTSSNPINIGANYGLITISIGGSLTINNSTQFSNQGSLVVNGTFISNTTFEAYPGSSITVQGDYYNNNWIGNEGAITISGGTWHNSGTLNNTFVIPGTIIVDCGGSIDNSGIFDVGNTTFNACSLGLTNSGTLASNSAITGDLTNGGILAPGNSPGIYTVTQNYLATSSATHNFEIAGTSSTLYDRLEVTGTATLNGSLNVSLISGYTPSGVYDLPIITGSPIVGTFSSVNLPSGYTIVYNSTNVTLHYGTVLPVSLTKFDASVLDRTIQLEWQTSYEQNNVGFNIERSADGGNWQSLSFIAGHSNSLVVESYSYSDINPLQGINYYRLKQVDIDGKFSYSPVISVSIKKAELSIFYTNPVKDRLYFLVPQTGSITVFNTKGQKVFKKELSNTQSLDLHQLPPGEYIIQLLKKEGSIQSGKLIIVD